ncbi:type II toxin-antitoxin system RelE/ParE family toxin [Terrimonas pollutisoli]|uniref:type II toxin-antitoxin system RelE/ParE family toxin n=1 Tax=Terrimonas pollutisoli TaxID=3034147 RepID=UPI0023EC56C2|nr:type II toxin-antitoxin system RelE/ParE family toxin [Terrimonas sp. H1YJ31]
MVKRVVWTNNAHNERKEILLYWKTHNQSGAYSRKLNELFKKAVKLICAHPQIGRKTDVENVRVKLVRDYLLFYEETDDAIVVLSVWDNRRNPDDAPY